MQPIPETLPLRQGPIIFGYRQVGKERVPAMHLEREALGSDEVSALSTLHGLQPARRIFTIIASKCTFMLLGTLTALQAGKVERAGPLLTLPVAGP